MTDKTTSSEEELTWRERDELEILDRKIAVRGTDVIAERRGFKTLQGLIAKGWAMLLRGPYDAKGWYMITEAGREARKRSTLANSVRVDRPLKQPPARLREAPGRLK